MQVYCEPNINKSLWAYVNQAYQKFVYISGCASTEGEFDGSGIPTQYLLILQFQQCNIQWGVTYQMYITERQGVITSDDVTVDFTCSHFTGTMTVHPIDLTVTPTADISLATNFDQPNIFMKLTDGNNNRDGPALLSAAAGDIARLHIWTDNVYTENPGTGIDIRARTILVNTGGSFIILTGLDGPGTYPGCKAKLWWGEAVKIAPGYVMVEFQVFLLAPGNPSYSQTYYAVVDTCAATPCPDFPCSSNAAGGSTSQAGRRRRDMSSDVVGKEIYVSTSVRVTVESESKADHPVNLSSTSTTTKKPEESCEICADYDLINGVLISLASAIFIIMAVNIYLYFRSRELTFRSRALQDESMSETKSQYDQNDCADASA